MCGGLSFFVIRAQEAGGYVLSSTGFSDEGPTKDSHGIWYFSESFNRIQAILIYPQGNFDLFSSNVVIQVPIDFIKG